MAFHCDKCGTDLAGEYTVCPVCARIEELMKSISKDGVAAASAWAAKDEPVEEEATFYPVDEPEKETEKEPEPEIQEETVPERKIETAYYPVAEVVEETIEDIPIDELDDAEPEVEIEGIPVVENEPEEEDPYSDFDSISSLFGHLDADKYEADAVEVEAVKSDESNDSGKSVIEAPEVIEVSAVTIANIPVQRQPVTEFIPDIDEPFEEEENAEEKEPVLEKAELTDDDIPIPEFMKEPRKEYGVLEQQLLDKAEKAGVKPADKKKGGNAFFAVLIIIMTIVLAFATAHYVVFPMIEKKSQDAAAEPYFDYIEGTWVSEYFAFSERPSECCVEVLTINPDKSFEMSYYLPDTEHKDGWKNDTWECVYKVTGKAKIVAETQRLMLIYEEDDVSYYYDRYFVQMEDGQMYLRDYYDETHTSYYDVCFNKAVQ